LEAPAGLASTHRSRFSWTAMSWRSRPGHSKAAQNPGINADGWSTRPADTHSTLYVCVIYAPPRRNSPRPGPVLRQARSEAAWQNWPRRILAACHEGVRSKPQPHRRADQLPCGGSIGAVSDFCASNASALFVNLAAIWIAASGKSA
jgi:hypothetical protein